MKSRLLMVALILLPGAALSACTRPAASSPTPTASQILPTPIPSKTPRLRPRLPLDLRSGDPLTIYALSMLDASRGWGIGQNLATIMDHLLFTEDGGRTWQERTPERLLAQTRPIFSLAVPYFMDERHVWVVYASREPSFALSRLSIWVTNNGGGTWEESQPLSFGDLSPVVLIPKSLGFSDLLHGWLMVHLGGAEGRDEVAIFTTGDGGASWERVADPRRGNLEMRCQKNGLLFTDPQRGWLTGSCEKQGLYFYLTQDGGRRWQAVLLPDPADAPGLFGYPDAGCTAEQLHFANTQNGWLVVRCTVTGAKLSRAWLYRTGDGGQSWTAQIAPSLYGSYQFLDGLAGWWLGAAQPDAVEGVGLYQTGNGGRTWTQIISPIWQGQLDFIDARQGWVVARGREAVALLVTSDGGITWETIEPLAE